MACFEYFTLYWQSLNCDFNYDFFFAFLACCEIGADDWLIIQKELITREWICWLESRFDGLSWSVVEIPGKLMMWTFLRNFSLGLSSDRADVRRFIFIAQNKPFSSRCCCERMEWDEMSVSIDISPGGTLWNGVSSSLEHNVEHTKCEVSDYRTERSINVNLIWCNCGCYLDVKFHSWASHSFRDLKALCEFLKLMFEMNRNLGWRARKVISGNFKIAAKFHACFFTYAIEDH